MEKNPTDLLASNGLKQDQTNNDLEKLFIEDIEIDPKLLLTKSKITITLETKLRFKAFVSQIELLLINRDGHHPTEDDVINFMIEELSQIMARRGLLKDIAEKKI